MSTDNSMPGQHQATVNRKSKRRTSLSELMKACGSESGEFEAESPEQWLWLLANGEGRERALAWIKLHSIGRGSAWCVDLAGKPARIEQLASDLGWELQSARNACAQLTSEGRIRTQAGRIMYRADVPAEIPPTQNQQDTEKNTLYRVFPAYLHDFIRKLPDDRRARLEAYAEFRGKLYAEGLAAVRFIDDQLQDSILTEVGCKEKRHLKMDRTPRLEWVNVTLAKPPNCVQSNSAAAAKECTESPKTMNAVTQNAVQASVQSDATLCHSEAERETDKKIPTPSSLDYNAIAERLQIDDDAARRLLAECRKVEATITPREVCILAWRKWHQVKNRSSNSVGLFIVSVPKMCSGALLAAARKDAAAEIETERRDAKAWLEADPRDYDTPDLAESLRVEQQKAVAKLAQLDAETIHLVPTKPAAAKRTES